MGKLITKEGLKKIEEEIEYRKNALRQEIAQAIKDAKEQGDLSENAEYAEAKLQQNENETRIAELEMIIKDSEVVSPSKKLSGLVQIGSVVKVKFNGSEVDFNIVGSNEADPAKFKISNESPLGKSFMGKKKDDEVQVETPGGKMKYNILEVK